MRARLKSLRQWWISKPEKERKRLKSFIPLIAYTLAFVYFVIWKSILDTQYRNRKDSVVIKNWFGGDRLEVIAAREKEIRDIRESYNELRKRVSGGR